MELIVAMMIITAVLFALVAVQVAALTTTIHAKQRQQGTAVANEVMEELRALPWATLQKGLHPDFALASGGDPNIDAGRLRPVHDSSIDEVVVTTSNQVLTAPPLSGASGTNRTVRQDPAAPGIYFVARTYVTLPSDLATGVLQLTAIVTWTEQGSNTERTTIVRSAAYNPRSGGCGDTTTQPFLGACQAMLDADAGARGFSISVSGLDPDDPANVVGVVPGGTALFGSYNNAETSATMTSNQTATSTARVVSAGSAENSAVSSSEAGWLQVSNSASTDVGAAGAPPANPPDVAANGAVSAARSFTSSPPGVAVSVSPPASLTGYARTRSGGTCQTGIPVGQPCSQAATSSEGSSETRLSVPGGNFAAISTSGASTRNAWTSRFATLPSTVTTLGCGSIVGAGCVSSGASRSFGTVQFGVGAWQRLDGSPGPNAQLVQLTGFSDSVRVEHGVGKGGVNPVTSRSGNLTYWNGSTMATLSLSTSSATSVDIPEVRRMIGTTEIIASGAITVRPAATVRLGADPACAAEGCGVTAEMPSVTVSLTYTILGEGDPHTVAVGFDLGSVRAMAKYKAAPDA